MDCTWLQSQELFVADAWFHTWITQNSLCSKLAKFQIKILKINSNVGWFNSEVDLYRFNHLFIVIAFSSPHFLAFPFTLWVFSLPFPNSHLSQKITHQTTFEKIRHFLEALHNKSIKDILLSVHSLSKNALWLNFIQQY